MVSATRETSWRTPVSRSGVPILPCRYLLATMLVAVMDQSLGTSTFFCSKITLPCASVIWARRRSHSTSSYGETPGLVKKRRKERPGAFFLEMEAFGEAVAVSLTVLISGIKGSPIRFYGCSCRFGRPASGRAIGVVRNWELLKNRG